MSKLRQTSVEKHERRAQIERDLVLGIPFRRLSKRYGISPSALCRYRQKLPAPMKAAMLAQALKPSAEDLEALRVEESEGLLKSLSVQRCRLLLAQDACLASEQYSIATQVSSEIHKNLALVGRLLGELSNHHVVTQLSLMVSPEYLQLRASLLRALQPYPEAHKAVAAAIHRLETEAAQRAPQPVLEATALPAPGGTHA